MARGAAAAVALLVLVLTACGIDGSARPSLTGRAVDTERPAFSNPTAVTHPLFPAATVAQVVQLGVDGGQPLRVEVTLMPDTRSIEWDGTTVEAVVVQFIAYRNRRVIEVAYDYFAQADDGSVWYFGEVVDNYGGGRISNHSGSWLAGREGPPGMIMPADPRVGDIYHPENIPGVVFEELIVLETGVTIAGPNGEISGAISVEEHLMDGGVERKIWAPGYGEFRAEATNELVTVAVAAPTDARSGPMPEALVDLGRTVAAAVAGGEARVAQLRAGWNAYRSQAPPLIAEAADAAMASLEAASAAGDEHAVRQSAIDLQLAVLDLELQFRKPGGVDLDRLAAWMSQLQLDVDAQDRDAVRGDAAIGSVIWARSGPAALGSGSGAAVDAALAALEAAASSDDLPGTAAAAADVLVTLGQEPPD